MKRAFTLPMLAALLLAFVLTPGAAVSQGKFTVYVVNYPLKYFAERIGSESVEVVFPAPGGIDPAYWMPDEKTIAAYQEADLIVLNGANYAKWVGKASLPRAKTVDTSSKFRDEYISSEEVTTHSHGPEGKHSHESLAFTTWLDLDLASRQAERIATALGRRLPERKAEFEKNFEALRRDLEGLDSEFRGVVASAPGTPLVGSHPVYDYLARRYGMNMKSVHWEPDEVPGMEQWNDLKHLLEEHSAKWMVWEGEPMAESVKNLEKLGVKSLVFDPCGNVPVAGDFLAVMKANAKNLRQAYSK